MPPASRMTCVYNLRRHRTGARLLHAGPFTQNRYKYAHPFDHNTLELQKQPINPPYKKKSTTKKTLLTGDGRPGMYVSATTSTKRLQFDDAPTYIHMHCVIQFLSRVGPPTTQSYFFPPLRSPTVGGGWRWRTASTAAALCRSRSSHS